MFHINFFFFLTDTPPHSPRYAFDVLVLEAKSKHPRQDSKGRLLLYGATVILYGRLPARCGANMPALSHTHVVREGERWALLSSPRQKLKARRYRTRKRKKLCDPGGKMPPSTE